MKRTSLLAAVITVVVSNGFTLAHAWLNRIGRPDAAITLTEKELRGWNSRPENSGVDLNLAWNGWDPELASAEWATRHNMEQLGFDYSVSPDNPRAAAFYDRQYPRRAFVALQVSQSSPEGSRSPGLRVIDVALDASALRGRHPDIRGTIIVPGVVSIEARPVRKPELGMPAAPAEITGRITELPVRIHVPSPFSEVLEQRGLRGFRLHLNYGALHEPWVTGVDFPSDH